MALFKSDKEPRPSVVIATMDRALALYTIARAAEKAGQRSEYELEVRYTDKFEPIVASTQQLLRKCFGWQEIDRGTKRVPNTKCRFKQEGYCTHPENLRKQDLAHAPPLRCTEDVRKACPLYECKTPEGILVSFVLLEQAGQIRDM